MTVAVFGFIWAENKDERSGLRVKCEKIIKNRN